MHLIFLACKKTVLELGFHSATLLMPQLGLSFSTSVPWAALYRVFCPALTKQAAKAFPQVCKPTLTAPLSTTLTPQHGKETALGISNSQGPLEIFHLIHARL